MRSFLNRLAELLSFLLHPIFLPFTFGLIAYDGQVDYRYHIWVGLTTIGIPGVATSLYLTLIKEPQKFVVERSNRMMPLLSVLLGTALLALSCWHLLPGYMFPFHLIVLLGLLTIAALMVTLYWKISLHMIGWGAALGGVVAVRHILDWDWLNIQDLGAPIIASNGLLMVILSAILLTAWARIWLGSHNIAQILAGLMLGFSLTFAWLYLALHL